MIVQITPLLNRSHVRNFFRGEKRKLACHEMAKINFFDAFELEIFL